MSLTNIGITAIEQASERDLRIAWSDGMVSNFDVVVLRRNCPCALCVDEWTHKRTLKAEAVADSVRPRTIESVGRYAIKIAFNDSHSTGIYTYEFLRRLNSSL